MNREVDVMVSHKLTNTKGQPMGYKEPVAHPVNCKEDCPYGYGQAFCFPCMARLLAEQRAAKKNSTPVERVQEKEGLAI